MRWMGVWSFLAVSCLFLQNCATECSAATCSGCCKEGVCYEGGKCDEAVVTPGTKCKSVSDSCAAPTDCCSADFNGNPVSCVAGTCVTTCTKALEACNAQTCCADPTSTSTYSWACVLSSNKCELCTRKGKECSVLADCCPGTQCLVKPGFPNIQECQ